VRRFASDHLCGGLSLITCAGLNTCAEAVNKVQQVQIHRRKLWAHTLLQIKDRQAGATVYVNVVGTYAAINGQVSRRNRRSCISECCGHIRCYKRTGKQNGTNCTASTGTDLETKVMWVFLGPCMGY
jgi:hypothetical protein